MIVETDTTESELVKALQEALEGIDEDNERNTITTKEYIEATGLTEYSARKQLDELCDSGMLKRVYISRVNDWGDRQRIKGYRYVGDVAQGDE